MKQANFDADELFEEIRSRAVAVGIEVRRHVAHGGPRGREFLHFEFWSGGYLLLSFWPSKGTVWGKTVQRSSGNTFEQALEAAIAINGVPELNNG
jgi:hypothetical protein